MMFVVLEMHGLCLITYDLHVILLEHGYGLFLFQDVTVLSMKARVYSFRLWCDVEMCSRFQGAFHLSLLCICSMDICALMGLWFVIT
jgi:hypothetical protein